MIFPELCLVLDPQPHGGPLNMALDEVLLQSADRPLLRCYGWEEPTVSFGYFGRLAQAQARWPGQALVRRWTGGGMVPHGDDFTYTLVVPRGHPFARLLPAESYRAIHGGVIEALGGVGETFSLSAGEPAVSAECFAQPVRHDVVAGRFKIAGAAQRRTRAGLLHQGSIQRALDLDFSEALAASLATHLTSRALTADEWSQADALATRKYNAPDWLSRR